MGQTDVKVIGWTTVYNISGVALLVSVQARSRDEAVSLLELAGFVIAKPEAVQLTITVGHKHHKLVASLRSANVDQEAGFVEDIRQMPERQVEP